MYEVSAGKHIISVLHIQKRIRNSALLYLKMLTIEIHCHACKKYMFSEVPRPTSGIDPPWIKRYYCEKKQCQEQKLFDKLQDRNNLRFA